jgi:hypothetical protein
LYRVAEKIKRGSDQSWSETFKAYGINYKNYNKARNIRRMIVDACCKFIHPKRMNLSPDKIRDNTLRVIRNGFKNSIYTNNYGQYHGPSGFRSLDRESVIPYGTKYVMGLPFDINGKNKSGRAFSLTLLTSATAVSEEFVLAIQGGI